jgi:hypothetical protein
MQNITNKSYDLLVLLLHNISLDATVGGGYRQQASALLRKLINNDTNYANNYARNKLLLLKNFEVLIEPFLGKRANFKINLQQASEQLKKLNFDITAKLKSLKSQYKYTQESWAVAE